MTTLLVERLRESTVRDLHEAKWDIQLDPDYQRQGDIWSLERRRLLIDSMLNGYDIPKIYFRSFVPRQEVAPDRVVRFAVIDGRQRLETIWRFIEGEFDLGNSTEVRDFDGVDFSGMTFEVLQGQLPELAKRFLDFSLDVVTIETDDEDLIDDMFLRLNEAAPLNAAEKRNAFGGLVPTLSRQLAEKDYFRSCLPFPNSRFRHYDMATKFLYFEDRDGVADTKKLYLDRFAISGRQREDSDLRRLFDEAKRVLEQLEAVFQTKDPLLSAVGMSSVYYLAMRTAMHDGWVDEFTRARLMQFDQARQQNREAARDDEAEADYDLLEFERYAQSSNDAVALRFRRDVLLEFMGHSAGPTGEGS